MKFFMHVARYVGERLVARLDVYRDENVTDLSALGRV